MTSDPIRRERHRPRHQGEGHVKTEAEIGVMTKNSKDCSLFGRIYPSILYREHGPMNSLISDIYAPIV